jgi:hypothetical protein
MKNALRLNHLLLSFFAVLAYAQAGQGTLEGHWTLDRAWSNSSADAPWIPATQWQSDLSATLAIDMNGIGIEATVDDDNATLERLYVDISTNKTDWTIGRKPQEWSYGFNSEQLNWVQNQSIILREQYFSFGSWQSLCLNENSQVDCAMRLSGWFSQADWQLQAAYGEYWRTAAGVQVPFGLGGLLFGEIYWSENEPTLSLQQVAPSVATVANQPESMTQINFGAQWTSSFNLTLQVESLVRNQGLDSMQWHTIVEQLNTPNAGLVSSAFAQPFGRSQHMIRLAQSWQSFEFESINLYWPDASNSWLHELNLGYVINDQIDLEINWQHARKGSVLNRIGLQDSVSVTLNFKDGFAISQ